MIVVGRSGKGCVRHRILKEVQCDIDFGRVWNRLTLKGMNTFLDEMMGDLLFSAMGRPKDDRVLWSLLENAERLDLEMLLNVVLHVAGVLETAIGKDLFHIVAHIGFLLLEEFGLGSVVGGEGQEREGLRRNPNLGVVSRVAGSALEMLMIIIVAGYEDQGLGIVLEEAVDEGFGNHCILIYKDDGRLIGHGEGFAVFSNHLVNSLVGTIGLDAEFMGWNHIADINVSGVL